MRYLGGTSDDKRTRQDIADDAALALETGAPVNGIKKPSALQKLPNFHSVCGYSLDCMRCVLQGVTTQVTEYLFDTLDWPIPY